jgi:hypothetical protein
LEHEKTFFTFIYSERINYYFNIDAWWKIAHTYVEDNSNLIEFALGFESTLKFTADNRLTGISTNGETETGVWTLINSEKTISLQTSSGQYNWDIQKLTNQEFWFRFLSGSGNYVVYKCEIVN